MTSVAREQQLSAYRRTLRGRRLIIAALIVGCLISLFADLVTGPSGLDIDSALSALLNPGDVPRSVQVIVWQVRLPVAVMALLVGAALALAGVEMQTILGNPLAEPFTLGVSWAAALGAALAIVLGFGIPGVSPSWIISANAFVFSLASLLLLQLFARLRGAGPETLVLFGIALGFTTKEVLSLVQFMASADALQQLVFWTMGSLARADWSSVTVLAVVLACVVPFSFASAWKFTALRLGDDRARSFGVNVARLRFLALIRISLLAASAVAFVGIIGFVGLVGPHVARMLVGEDHRFFLPASLFTGALMMSLASIASKMIIPGILLPIGIVTALVGLPVFFVLIVQRQGAVR